MTSGRGADHGSEAQLLDAAVAGDERAFERLVRPYRRELLAHCYRMTGSVHDADDALQDAMVRAWKGLAGFAARSSLRTWLYKIATNASLALIERNSRRSLPIDPLPDAASDRAGRHDEPTWLGPFPYDEPSIESPDGSLERRESIELAFVAALQFLPATQRAVLILRDVMGFSAKETATLLDVTVPTVTSSLQRARATIQDRLPDRSQQATLHALGDDRIATIVDAYVDAWERRDTPALVALLAEDATFSMPPDPALFHGTDAIGAFLVEAPFTHRWRLIPTRANGQLAFGCYRWVNGQWKADSVDVLTMRDDKIERITAFHQPHVLGQLGLPAVLP